MKLIVGLGNPGKEYRDTRHNIGFNAVEKIAEHYDFSDLKKALCENFQARVAAGEISGEKMLLAKPQTFMNGSGKAVEAILHYYKLIPADLIVIYDDFLIAPGVVRIRASGSAGGHNGMKSIIAQLKSEDFIRLRIGIAPLNAWQGGQSDYVLGRLNGEEKERIEPVLQKIPQIIESILEEGIEAAMNQFNQQ